MATPKGKAKELQIWDRVSFTQEGWEAHLQWYEKEHGRLPDMPFGGQTTFRQIKHYSWRIDEIDYNGDFVMVYGKYHIGRIPPRLANKWFELVKE